jgi:putative ABC transport system substrate-binding protein
VPINRRCRIFREKKLMKKLLSLLCVLAFAAASSGGAAAQTAGKSYRVGFLTIGAASVPVVAATLDSLARSLEKHGYTVGKNLLIESRFADGDVGRLHGMVKELVD